MATHAKGSARETRALDTYRQLTRAVETLGGQLQRHLASLELTPPQLAVLEALLHHGPLSQGELGRRLLRGNPSVTALVDTLERRGWAQRERGTEDRRVVTVSLTAPGRRVVEKAFPAHAAHLTALLGVLGAEEQETLGALCEKLGRALAGD